MRKLLVLALLVVLALCIALPALAAVYLPPDPHPRFNSQAVWANGKVHWYGGYATTVTNPVTKKTYDNNRQSGYSIYDPVSNTWKSSKWSDEPQVPAALDNNGDGVTTAGEGVYPGTSQSFAYDSDSDGTLELYVHAGYPVWESHFFRYDPDTNQWTKHGPDLRPSGLFGGGNYAQYLGVAALDSAAGKVYCAGGGFWGPTNDSFAVFDIAAETWTALPNLPVTCIGHVGAVISGKLYIAGGNQGGTGFQTGIYAFDLTAGTWSPTPVANLLTGVERAGVSVYNNKLYIIGGQASTGDSPDIQVFDPATNSVTATGTLPIGMSRHGACIDPATGDIYVGAGRQGGAYPATEKWWKGNINASPIVWTALPDDPAYFPYTEWYAGGETLSGTVTGPDGKLASLAVVGVKKTGRGGNAMADAQYYALTDGSGRYSVNVPPGDYNVAAWKIRHAPGADVPFTMGATPATLDLQITNVAGANIAPGSTIYFSDQSSGEPAANAIDDTLGTRWATPGGSANHYYIIDLGSVKSVTGITIFWETARAGVYSIDLTNDDPNPSGTAAWTTAYNCVKGGGGFDMGYGYYVDAIRLSAGTQARGIRITLSAYGSWPTNYSAWEFIVHGTTPVTPYQTILEVKALPDGTPVELLEPVSVSGASGLGDSTIFPNTFWIQSTDRSHAIRCEYTTAWAWPGEYDQIKGTMATDPATGERYIQVTDVQSFFFLGQTFAPVGMNNRALTETSLPLGLYVKTWGKVTEVNETENWYKISDGSPTPVKVISDTALPQVDTFVTVTGAVSAASTSPGSNTAVIYQWTFDGYIRNWLLHGGYSVQDPSGTGDWFAWQQANLNQDFLASVGGEAAIQPLPDDVGPNGGKWFLWSLKPWDWNIDLNQPTWIPSGQGHNTIYASTWVYADRAYTSIDGLEIWIGTDDGYKIYVNGVTAGELTNNVWRAATRDEDKIPSFGWAGDIYTLNAGWNHILVKVNNITGGFGMGMRIMVTDPTAAKVPLSLMQSAVPW